MVGEDCREDNVPSLTQGCGRMAPQQRDDRVCGNCGDSFRSVLSGKYEKGLVAVGYDG